MRRVISGLPDEALGLLHLVAAIDRAYVGVRLTRPAVVPDIAALGAVVRRWERTGSLEREAAGMVLRKGSHWRAGSSLAHYCNDLSRVPPHLEARVDVKRHTAPASLGELLRSQGDDATLNVAFVPTLTAAGDLDLVPGDPSRGESFAVVLGAAAQEALERAAGVLVERLEAAETNLALLPETVACEAVLSALRAAVRGNMARSLRAGKLPHLRMLIVGVAGDRSNDAVLVGADGATLLRQPKTQRWRLDERQITRYGLEGVLGLGDRLEDIEEGAGLTVLDDPGFGRLVVLICEDLQRGATAWLLTTTASASTVATPICDASLRKSRWAYRAAERVAEEPGALVLVSNSFVLSDKQNRAAGGKGVGSAGVGIVCHPADWEQSEIVRGKPRAGVFYTRSITWTQAWA